MRWRVWNCWDTALLLLTVLPSIATSDISLTTRMVREAAFLKEQMWNVSCLPTSKRLLLRWHRQAHAVLQNSFIRSMLRAWQTYKPPLFLKKIAQYCRMANQICDALAWRWRCLQGAKRWNIMHKDHGRALWTVKVVMCLDAILPLSANYLRAILIHRAVATACRCASWECGMMKW